MNAKARRQNAAKNMYVPQVIFSSISGVTRPMMLHLLVAVPEANELVEPYKLHIQVVEVVMDIALDLIAIVNISDGKTQPIGARICC